MKDKSGCGTIAFWIGVMLLSTVLGAILFERVINSDMPMWLKYLILS